MAARLIYVVGASGCGKDSLLRYARARLGDDAGVCFAHRYITRAADAGGENHIALSREEFAARCRAKLFALHWESHGLAYGIGIEINQWLAKGVTVVVNGSRAYLPMARQRYPELLAVNVEVAEAVLRERLLARGRETAEEVERRLARHRELQQRTLHGLVIRNDTTLDAAGEALVAVIRPPGEVLRCA